MNASSVPALRKPRIDGPAPRRRPRLQDHIVLTVVPPEDAPPPAVRAMKISSVVWAWSGAPRPGSAVTTTTRTPVTALVVERAGISRLGRPHAMTRRPIALYRGVQLIPAPPFTAVGNNDVQSDAIHRHKARVTLISSRRLWLPCVNIVQAGRIIATRRIFCVVRPGRPVRVPQSFMATIDPVPAGCSLA